METAINKKLDLMILNVKNQSKTNIKGAYNGNYIPSSETLKLALEVWALENKKALKP